MNRPLFLCLGLIIAPCLAGCSGQKDAPVTASGGSSSGSIEGNFLENGMTAYPAGDAAPTLGGTMTFTDVGAPGYWARRLNREAGDSACDVKDGLDSWGGHCCLSRHDTTSTTLAPFDEEMTLLLKMVRVKQLAIYQPNAGERWGIVSAWDDRVELGHNFWFTASGDGSATFPGDLRDRDCVWYVSQVPSFDCGNGRDYFCPDDPGIKHLGWSGSKLIVLLADFSVDDAQVKACSGTGSGHPGPWVAFVASELTRDGGRKWNGDCNCYSRTGTVGDGCGEINLFEVVMDGNEWSNRDFASTGVRSYQAGHVGGSVCGTGCSRSQFPSDQDVVDSCAKSGFGKGPTLPMGGVTSGCPVWQRPAGDRYLVVLLDEVRRTLQVALINPKTIPQALAKLLPTLPPNLARTDIDAVADLRLPAGN